MTPIDALQATVSSLIGRKSEGTYWDFKREHHKSKSDLIHDVLCLANAQHKGKRFLVFGVDDKFRLCSIENDTDRRSQADLASIFRGNASRFFQFRFPEFYLQEITLEGKLLDVLVIENTTNKPYYLVERYKQIRAHHIYTRVCDTNTPVDAVAPPHEIERMWRDRFGLDMSPLDRVKGFLNEASAWSLICDDGCAAIYHHTTFPEFTLSVADAEKHIAWNEEWTRGEVHHENNHAGYYDVLFHQTKLARVRYVSFDDNRKSMVAPNWEARGHGRFYFYESDSVNYAVQQFYSGIRGDDSAKLSIGGNSEASCDARSRWGHTMKIPVLRPGELEEFLHSNGGPGTLEPSTDEVEQYELFLHNQLDFDNWRSRCNRVRY